MSTSVNGLLVGHSNAIHHLLQQIRQVAPTHAPVLIRGEKGSGKNLVAQLIHQGSIRSDQPFIKLRCSEMPANLLDEELLGHERGAIPGTRNARKGLLERTHGGTIFFDEIAVLAPSTQIKLLRVLQEREFEPPGGGKPVPVDVRLLAATQHPLEQLVRNEAFREDLYYRLSVFPIQIPPLREHKSDIPALTDHFLTKYARLHGRTVKGVSAPAMDLLTRHRWPGNVRELEECIERAILASTDGWIHIHHLSLTVQLDEAGGQPPWNLRTVLSHVEQEMITDALRSCHGNMAAAARKLGLTERMMGLRVHKYGIEFERFKPRHSVEHA